MGTVVYQQGFQSYLESQLIESRALRLRLSSPNPHYSQPFGLTLKSHSLDSSIAEVDEKATADSSGWSFLQSLTSGSSSISKTTSSDKEKTYVQRPSSCKTLSDESLALCTENLGSESGSDVTDVEDLFSQNKDQRETRTETRTLKSRRGNVSPNELPPPLTSMRGSQYIQMRPHREDGRLVMTATKAPPRNRCFQADRNNGRLRLSILKDLDEFVEKEEEMIETEEEDDEVMDPENVQRSRRCVEGDWENKGLLNWDFCVATS